ncbi:hypothetical protein BGW41_004110 [Actinomortierella wolfii]|nr:hypothetical protein BGW41_004110 [Actinomortierella wolfii]
MYSRVTKPLIPRLRPHSVTSFRPIHVSRLACLADRPASGSPATAAAATGGPGTTATTSAGTTAGETDQRPTSTPSSTTSPVPSDRPGDPSHSHSTTSPPEEFPYSPKGPKRRSFRRRPPAQPSTSTTNNTSTPFYVIKHYRSSSGIDGRQPTWSTQANSGNESGAGGGAGSHPVIASSINRDSTDGYMPVIPETFLQTHYTTVEANRRNLESLPYFIHRGIRQEVVQTMASCLLVTPHHPRPPANLQRLPAKHNNLVLSSPIQGSSIMLETLTMAAAKEVGADVLAIDVQDIMELTADISRGRKAASLWPMDRSLRGFNPYSLNALPTTQRGALQSLLAMDDDDTIEDIMLKMRQEDDEDEEEDGYGDDFDDDDDDYDDDDDHSAFNSDRRYYVHDPSSSSDHHHRSSRGSGSSGGSSLKDKLNRFWTALLVATPPDQPPFRQDLAKPKVLYLKDIADIVHTSAGSLLLPSLMDAVLTVREAGHNVMVVAGHSPSVYRAKDTSKVGSGGNKTNSSEDLAATNENQETKSVNANVWTIQSGGAGGQGAIQEEDVLRPLSGSTTSNSNTSGDDHRLLLALESLVLDRFPGPLPTFHHISIPPYMPLPLAATQTDAEATLARANQLLFESDQATRTREINVRNLQAVLRFREGGGVFHGLEGEKKQMTRTDALDVFGNLPGIDREVWGFGKVYRIISMALGSLYLEQRKAAGGSAASNSSGDDDASSSSLSTKQEAGDDKERLRRALVAAMEVHQANTDLRQALVNRAKQAVAPKQTVKHLVHPKDCTRHERRLLGCIVDPDKIKTTFSNTVIPADTIQALQTMITLPLLRPDIFSQGLLKHEFLPGMLLFGPPGTGKTLLAKAVAKESGARMLEIKASDVFDMYVGEGEKNVAAIFSLARKLAPCVIFLDEVDSIFRARGSAGSFGGGGGSHASQREILNQFMVEWDGIRSSGQNQGIVVMASTNRPFELDDAVVRRLPRRILVDLPDERARAQILNVYLSQEQLDPQVDIGELAKRTRLFSGSDLKNLCVSAVLAAVREAVEAEVAQVQAENGRAGEGLVGTTDSGGNTTSLERIGLGDSAEQKTLNLAPLLEKYRRENKKKTLESSPSSAPPTRVLTKAHFDKAFQQITPSCSEDMSSLVELRKWDGLYGDGGKQRRKVLKTLGFDIDVNTATTSATGSGKSL